VPREREREEGVVVGARAKGDTTCGDDRYRRPDGVDDATVAAVGAVTEAIEWLERARGHLYDFHQLVGHVDELLSEAAEQLRAAERADHADIVEREAVGRNVIDGRWTFQLVDEFEDHYYLPLRAVERQLRDELLAGRRHVYEAEMKQRRHRPGRAGEAHPTGDDPPASLR
jgi:hypothetical protein